VEEFVSEPIAPTGGAFDCAAMARGEPGLPGGFVWRGAVHRIVALAQRWKETSAEGAHAGGQIYLRRHYFKLRMDNGQTWTVYFLRQTPKSGPATVRWFLYLVEEGAALA